MCSSAIGPGIKRQKIAKKTTKEVFILDISNVLLRKRQVFS
jgi:hypothetical protein